MRMRVVILSLLWATTLGKVWAQTQLTEAAQVSVLTIGSGKSLNDAFGHNAFRIQDDSLGIDYVFDYGRYDFNAPNFYLKFARGKLDYLLGLSNFQDFYQAYVLHDRMVQQQWLNLNQQQKQNLFELLKENYKTENRAYKYDFFYNNCATKIRDVLNQATTHQITFNTPRELAPKTFRTLIQDELHWNSWGSMGIDIALGAKIDKTATPQEHMFLPKYIHTFFGEATLPSGQPLVLRSETLYSQQQPHAPPSFWSSPVLVMLILALIIIGITLKTWNSNKRNTVLDVTIVTITGIIGILLVLLWFATDHTATAFNYNLLWAFPLNLVLAIQLRKQNPPRWVKPYIKLLLVLLALLTLHWCTGVQRFALALLPLLVALAWRYVFVLKSIK